MWMVSHDIDEFYYMHKHFEVFNKYEYLAWWWLIQAETSSQHLN